MQWPTTRLVRYMLSGFPTVGEIPDSEIWRPCSRPADCTFEAFTAENVKWTARCKQRVIAAAKADPVRAVACWNRTMEECASGLILGPFSIAQLNQPNTTFPGLGYGKWRPLPRFAIQQKRQMAMYR